MTLRPICGLALISLLTLSGCDAAKSKGGGSGSGGSASGSAAAQGAPAAVAPAAAEVTLTPLKLTAIKDLLASKKGKIIVVDTLT